MGTLSLVNANILTMNPQAPVASGMVIRDGRIQGLINGESRSNDLVADGEQIDLNGYTILPGLCDSHIHLEKYALFMDQVNCETGALSECLEKIKIRCDQTPAGEWVLGHGWNQNTWGQYGTLEALDAVSTNHPVYLTAKSLHAGWANSRALELANLSNASPDPPKGKFGRTPQGQLNGLLYEDAMLLLSSVIPKPSESTLIEMIVRAQARLHEYGITSIHDFDGERCLRALLKLEQDDRLRLRVMKQIREKEFPRAVAEDYRSRFRTDWIRIGHLKLFADGALGPRTAAMLNGYESDTDNVGMLLFSTEEIVEIGIAANQSGYPLAVHAIGDKANRTVLDAFDVLKNRGIVAAPFPHRIEHVQLLQERDVPRLAKLDVTASMQPIHALSDLEMAKLHWGERVRWSYAWNSQFETGAHVIFGSDAPVETPDPWAGIFASIARRPVGSAPDTPVWVPEECISIDKSIRAYTSLPAACSPWKSLIGQIAPGYAADIIILDRNPMEMDADAILKIQPCAVMVNGEWMVREF